MGTGKSTKSQYIRYGALALLVVVLLVSVFMLISKWENRGGNDASKVTSTMDYNGSKYTLKDDVETFLVIGIDKFEEDIEDGDNYNTNMHADYVVLYVLDNESKHCTALHISRDAMVEYDKLGLGGKKVGTERGQLSLSYSEGNGDKISCRNTANAVEWLLKGIDVDHFASVTMDTVITLNDLVGGVELTVLDDFTGIDETLVKDNKVVLTGSQALTYVRSREGMDDSTNNNRINRQKQYLGALAAKMEEKATADEAFALTAIEKIGNSLISDRSHTQLELIANKLLDYQTEITVLEGESRKGEMYMEFYPDEKALMETIIKLFYEKAE